MNAIEKLRNDVHVVTTNWYVNRCPLVTRTPWLPVPESGTFTVGYRLPRRIGDPMRGITQCCQVWRRGVPRDHPPSRPFDSGRQPFDSDRMNALELLMGDMEFTSFYGTGGARLDGKAPEQYGLRNLVANLAVGPGHADGYTPADLIRDAIDPCRRGGGDPDVVLVSADIPTGFATWGHALQRIDAGVNIFGTPIDVFETAALPGVSVIEAPLLKPGTLVALTSAEVRMRVAMNERWGSTGGGQGYWVAEGAIDLDQLDHHAWVEGIRGFA